MEELKKISLRNLNKRHEEHFVRWFEGKVSSIFYFSFLVWLDQFTYNRDICFQTEFADLQAI